MITAAIVALAVVVWEIARRAWCAGRRVHVPRLAASRWLSSDDCVRMQLAAPALPSAANGYHVPTDNERASPGWQAALRRELGCPRGRCTPREVEQRRCACTPVEHGHDAPPTPARPFLWRRAAYADNLPRYAELVAPPVRRT